MDWSIQDLGSVGEFVGSVAVVVTLVYLVIQVRQTNRLHQSLARQNYADAAQRRIELLLKYPDVRQCALKLFKGEDLTDDESFLMRMTTRYRLRGYENDFYQHRSGLIADEEFNAIHREIGLGFKDSGFRREDWLANKETLTESFVREVDRIIDEYASSDEAWGLAPGTTFPPQ